MNDKHRAALLELCKKARAHDRAIGQWWFGPTAGTYYVLDLRSDRIEAGESGMSLDELAAWIIRLERRRDSSRKVDATAGGKRRFDRRSSPARANL